MRVDKKAQQATPSTYAPNVVVGGSASTAMIRRRRLDRRGVGVL